MRAAALLAASVLLAALHCCAALPVFVGKPASAFEGAVAVYQDQFQEVSLKNFRGQYVVLFFYPLDFTFVCPTELTAYSDRIAEFKAINTQVLGVSVDSQYAHLQWNRQPRKEGGLGELKYPLVSDLKKEISEAYGVLTDEGVALRGLFIIDKEGVVQHSTINNLAFGRSVDETIRVLQAVQHTQTHKGEGCPANWTPGSKTISTTPKASQAYFSSLA